MHERDVWTYIEIILHIKWNIHCEFVAMRPLDKLIITHAHVHINDFRGVRARYVKRTG